MGRAARRVTRRIVCGVEGVEVRGGNSANNVLSGAALWSMGIQSRGFVVSRGVRGQRQRVR